MSEFELMANPVYEQQFDLSTDIQYKEIVIDIQPLTNLELEKLTFNKQKSKLMNDPNFQGKYVAVINGKIVDSDLNEAELIKRVYKDNGYISILIDKIEEEVQYTTSPTFEIN